MGPGDLQEILNLVRLTSPQRPHGENHPVLVGTETGDDAGVYQLSPEQALITTADYITPLLDDPVLFGRIAAVNSLSDVYAMGGQPVTALNLCVFPKDLDRQVASEILEGARAAVEEAGAHVVGGHTVYSKELLFGLAVTGLVHPKRIWRNVGAEPGDALVLTKPLGTGLLITALRQQRLARSDIEGALLGMAQLNRRAQAVLLDFPVHAATDVTGFGLLGHALGMTRSGKISLRLQIAALPLYDGAWALAQAGITCGGAKANRKAYGDALVDGQSLSQAELEVVSDPQTSGGLLCALPKEQVPRLLERLFAEAGGGWVIGEVLARRSGDGNSSKCVEFTDFGEASVPC